MWRNAVFGHERGWLHDQRGDVLVVVDPQTLRARVHRAALFGDADASTPARLLTTARALWAAREGRLIRVDPDVSACHEVSVPVTGERPRWAALRAGLVGTDWPSGRVFWVGEDGRVTTSDLGGHLADVAAGDRQVWILDRTEETLLGVDGQNRQLTCRVPFDRGRVEFLIPVGTDVLVSHRGDVGRGGRDQVWRVGRDGQRTLVVDVTAEPGGLLISASDEQEWFRPRLALVASSDGATLWLGEVQDADVDRDPITALRSVDVRTGRVAQPVQVVGQVLDLSWALGRLWYSGFLRSRQEAVLGVVDPATGHLAEVDFSDADVGPYLPRWADLPAPDWDEQLARLLDDLRAQLTTTSPRQDPRTGERRPGAPAVHEHFRLLDLALDRVEPSVLVTFEWADEPGVRFAYRQSISIPPVTSSLAGDVTTFFTEAICTGLVQQAKREHRDGLVFLRRYEVSSAAPLPSPGSGPDRPDR